MNIDMKVLWPEFSVRLGAFVRSRIPDTHCAEDVLQLAFLRIHKGLSNGTVPENPKAWMFVVTRNAVADFYRWENSALVRMYLHEEHLEPTTEDLDVTDSATTTELAGCIEHLLQNIEAPYSEALRLTAIEGMTQKAAAKSVGISVSGMKSRVQRAHRKLRRLFDQCCSIELDARGKPIASELKICCPFVTPDDASSSKKNRKD